MFANQKTKGIATLWLIIAGFVLIAGSVGYLALKGNNTSYPVPNLPFYGINLKINNVHALLSLKEGDIVEINWEASSSREYNNRNCKGSGAPQNSKFNQNLANSGNIKETFSRAGEYELVINCALEKNNSSIPATGISDSIKVVVRDETTSNDTSTWKTYRNEKYGFEVKYQNNWSNNGSIFIGDNARFQILINGFGDYGMPDENTISAHADRCFDKQHNLYNGPEGCEIAVVNNNADFYQFYLVCRSGTHSECTDTFNSILSTFKFIK